MSAFQKSYIFQYPPIFYGSAAQRQAAKATMYLDYKTLYRFSNKNVWLVVYWLYVLVKMFYEEKVEKLTSKKLFYGNQTCNRYDATNPYSMFFEDFQRHMSFYSHTALYLVKVKELF